VEDAMMILGSELVLEKGIMEVVVEKDNSSEVAKVKLEETDKLTKTLI
jgi:hypothetical protein